MYKGYNIVLQVVSKGQLVGPVGVSLSLKKANSNDVLKTTKSTADGAYTFEKVLPGEYSVEGTHEKWKFEQVSWVYITICVTEIVLVDSENVI